MYAPFKFTVVLKISKNLNGAYILLGGVRTTLPLYVCLPSYDK